MRHDIAFSKQYSVKVCCFAERLIRELFRKFVYGMSYYFSFWQVKDLLCKHFIASLIYAFKISVKYRRRYRIKKGLKEVYIVLKVFFHMFAPGNFH
ncbi:hypothetical protein SDC9_210102 [bioreactor metagenome]|uniref:Uncharacterized protein n=1 Tax=bioreactor metagenome TaxID=1076179 RepID=A0A645JF81_9ZZZZ